MPCPHNEITIVQRSQRQSAVAAAAYQSGEKLFCEYDQQVKHYPEKRGIVHNEILLPANAPRSYADRNTLWNAARSQEKGRKARNSNSSVWSDIVSGYCPTITICCATGNRTMPPRRQTRTSTRCLWKPCKSRTMWIICWMCCSPRTWRNGQPLSLIVERK